MDDKPLPFDQRTVTTRAGDHGLHEAIPGQEVCDFCLSTAVAGAYDAGEVRVDVGNITNVSTDAWNACAACAACIDADEVDQLVDRAIEGIKTRQDESDTFDLTALLLTLTEFMNAKGEWRPL